MERAEGELLPPQAQTSPGEQLQSDAADDFGAVAGWGAELEIDRPNLPEHGHTSPRRIFMTWASGLSIT